MRADKQIKLTTFDEQLADRRSVERHKLMFRIGLIEQEGRICFCLVKDMSPVGVQVKLFGMLEERAAVTLQVGDDDSIPGYVAWMRDGTAGIEFDQSLSFEALMRVRQNLPVGRRRGAPRANTGLSVGLRTGGSRYGATLCDISLQGARLRTQRAVRFGESTMIEVPGLPSLKAYLRWTDGLDYGVCFETPLPIQIITALVQDGQSLQIR